MSADPGIKHNESSLCYNCYKKNLCLDEQKQKGKMCFWNGNVSKKVENIISVV